MKTSAGFPRRPSIRLKAFDYASSAAYFITICSHLRRCNFSSVVDGNVVLTDIGHIIERELIASTLKRPGFRLDEHTVMPNHLHFTCFLPPAPGRPELPRRRERTPRSLGSFIAGFKSAVTSAVRKHLGNPTVQVWQTGYFDRVIRDDDELNAIRDYIRQNPRRWEEDELYRP